MSSGPAPTKQFAYAYSTTYVDNTYYRIDSLYEQSVQVQDVSNRNGDNLDILGDIPNELFNVGTGGDANAFYIGTTAGNEEIISRYFSPGFALLTNRTYNSGDIVYNNFGQYVVCYASGTRICTTAGETAVEALKVGEFVVTASGEHRPIRWLGQRTVACRGLDTLMPVRIAAHAFGEGRPSRDLFVSPGHAIAMDLEGEVLIPAGRLVNGTTITQVDMESVTYWHVELDSHDILIAEGLPSESYLDCGNRRFFANADVTDITLLPDARPTGALPFCRPFHEGGPVVEMARARLEERAVALGWRKVEDAFAGLHLVADGRVIGPEIERSTARFAAPAASRDVRLVSETSVPAHVLPDSTDGRRLGVLLSALTVDGRLVALDDTRLGEGFHAVESGVRWTDGAARLPVGMWAGSEGTLLLHVTLAGPALPRWVAPDDTACAAEGIGARCRV